MLVQKAKEKKNILIQNNCKQIQTSIVIHATEKNEASTMIYFVQYLWV